MNESEFPGTSVVTPSTGEGESAMNEVVIAGAKKLVSIDRAVRTPGTTAKIGGPDQAEASVNFVAGQSMPGLTLLTERLDNGNTRWQVAIFEDPRNVGGHDFPTISLRVETGSEVPTYHVGNDEPSKADALVRGVLHTAADYLYKTAEMVRYSYQTPPEVTVDSLRQAVAKTAYPSDEWRESVTGRANTLLTVADLLQGISLLSGDGPAPRTLVESMGNVEEAMFGEHARKVLENKARSERLPNDGVLIFTN